MARIQTQQSDTPPSRLDKVIGSDVDNNLYTRNYILGEIFALFNDLGRGGVFNYTYTNDQLDHDIYTGLISTPSGELDSTLINSIRFSKNDLNGKACLTLLQNYLLNKDDVVLQITDSSDSNKIAVYKIVSVTSSTNYIDVSVLKHRGFSTLFFVDSQEYSLSFDYTFTGSILGGSGATNTSQLVNDGEDGTNPFVTAASIITDHSRLSGIGVKTHAVIDSHIDNTAIHFTMASISITESQISNLQNYLTSESDPVFSASPAAGILVGDITNWNTAFGWGNHASAGYLTSESDPVFSASPAAGILVGDITNWNTAFGWGNHASVGYLTSYTESDPVFVASPAAGILSTSILNWNTAFGWGNHASAGYLTSESDPVFSASPAAGIIVGDITNWNTAFGWGNHASVGYLISYTESDPVFVAHTVSNITNGTGFLKNNGLGSWTYDSSTYSLSSHTHTFASLTSKPITIAGYGITDAYTKTESDNKYLLNTTDTLTGDLTVTGLGTFANIEMSAASPFILGNVTSGIFSLASDNSILTGSGIKLYGSTHATQANDISFTIDGNTVGNWDDSLNIWSFAGVISGDGSSLIKVNATTLDGIDSTQFLRSDVEDSKTAGNLIINDGVGLSFGTSGGESRFLSDGVTTYFDLFNGDFKIRNIGSDTFTFGRTTGNFTNTGTITSQGTGNSSFAGNLGIGTTGLNVKLQVLTPSSTINVPPAGTYGGSVIISNDLSTYGMYIGSLNSGNGYIQQQRGDIATTYNLLLQPNGGNVGINTTAPSYKLDVNGTGRFTGDVIVPDEAYGAGWDGNLEVPTKNAIYDKIESLVPYKSYVAIMSQSGVADPTVTVLQNTLGGTIVWTRSTVGNFVGTLAGAFTTSKTVGFIQHNNNASYTLGENTVYYSFDWLTADTIKIEKTTQSNTSSDDLKEISLEIRVYI